MSKKNIKTTTICNSYKHSNLMMISTTIAICSMLVLMLLSTAFRSTISSLVLARGACGVISAVFFVAFVALGVLGFKKDKFLLEYAIYSIVMSLGFLSLLGTPFFLPKIAFFNNLFTTRNAQAGIMLANIIYIIGAFIYHNRQSSKQ